MVRNGILTVCFYIFFKERNSELFSLPLKDSEGNSESILLFVSTERNSELFSLPLKCSEGNSESSLLFGTDPDRNRALEETPRS